MEIFIASRVAEYLYLGDDWLVCVLSRI
jgi:hypothetical protein